MGGVPCCEAVDFAVAEVELETAESVEADVWFTIGKRASVCDQVLILQGEAIVPANQLLRIPQNKIRHTRPSSKIPQSKKIEMAIINLELEIR